MSVNPYESPSMSNEQSSAVGWYAWAHRAYWLAWISGTALIVLSWANVVSSEVGWTGFAITGGAVLVSYVLPHFVRRGTEDLTILSAQMVESKNNGYHIAIERFREGAVILYEGFAFILRPNNEIACAAIASVPIEHLNDLRVREDVERAQAVFESLIKSSPDFSTSVVGRTFSVSLLSEFGANAEELCDVVDDQIEWKAKSNHHGMPNAM